MMKVAVIGAGLIGRERLRALADLVRFGRPVILAGLYDSNQELCSKTAHEFATTAFESLEALLQSSPDWIVVALPHDIGYEVAIQALQSGARVLLEKPMGRNLEEAKSLHKFGGDRLHVGFNYRYFAGIRKLLQDARSGAFGRLIRANFVLGHGCAPGQEKTWKLDPIRAGGGCLIDPGVHLLDLCQLLAPGPIDVVGGTSWSGFWNTGVEEDVQVLLSSGDITMTADISIVRWRSTFRFEVHGLDGYGLVEGRNRSYGPQTYRTGRRWGWQSAKSQAESETQVLESDGQDSFSLEMADLLWPNQTSAAWPPPSTAEESLSVMDLLERIRKNLKPGNHIG